MKKLAFVVWSNTGAEIERVIFDMHWLGPVSNTANHLEVTHSHTLHIYAHMSPF